MGIELVQQVFLYGRMLPSNFMFRYPTCCHVSSRRHIFQGPWVFFVFGDWWIRLQTMKSLDTSFGPHAFPWINRQTQVKAGNRINKKTCCNLRTQTRSILGAFKGFSRVFIHKVEKTHMLVPNVFSGRWTTVDGWNPGIIDGSFIPLFTGGCLGFLPSTVWSHSDYKWIYCLSGSLATLPSRNRHSRHIQGVITVYFPLFQLKMLAADEVHSTRTHLQVLLSVSCKWTPTKDLLLNSAQCQRGV